MKKLIALSLCIVFIISCKKTADEETTPEVITPTAEKIYPDSVWNVTGTGPHLIFKFTFDSTQVRLDNTGQPSAAIPAGRWAYSPIFHKIASHYIELAAHDTTRFQMGTVLYHAPETTKGGAKAIEFCNSTVVREGATFFSVPLSSLAPGATYKWLRVSISYQNYTIPYMDSNLPGNHIGTGTVASFLGFNTYVPKYKINAKDYIPSNSVGGPTANHPQGYWGFETYIPGYPTNNGYYMLDGQSPAGTTTVVQPNNANAQIPAGTCVVMAQFTDATGTPVNFTVPAAGTQTANIVVNVSLSTNKSFEFTDGNGNKYYEPGIGEVPVDMGIRGMIPKVTY